MPFTPGVVEYARWETSGRHYRAVHVSSYAMNGQPMIADEVHRWDPGSELWQRTDLQPPVPQTPEAEPELRPVPARAVFTATTIRLKKILGWSVLASMTLTLILVVVSLDTAEAVGPILTVFFDAGLPIWLLWSLWMWVVRWGAARAGVDPQSIKGEDATHQLG